MRQDPSVDTLVRSGSLRGYLELMTDLVLDPHPLLVRHRIALPQLQSEDNWLSVAAVTHLLDDSASVADREDFGLLLSKHQDIHILGPLALVLLNSDTVGDAMQNGATYIFSHSTGIAVYLQPESAHGSAFCEFGVELQVPAYTPVRQGLDLCLAHLHAIFNTLAGGSYQLQAVLLPHSVRTRAVAYRRFFGVPVHMGQSHAALLLPKEILGRRLHEVNPTLRNMAREYIERHYDQRGQGLSDVVQQLIERALGTPHDQKPDIAKILSMHPRTLQRRLSAEGLTFERIKDDARQAVARKLLREGDLSISQISDMTGFSEPSAFIRASHRWWGVSPMDFRKAGN